MRARARSAPLEVAPGERVLAWAATADGTVVAGSRDAFYAGSSTPDARVTTRVPWEQVEAADWDTDTSVLRIREVGTWGEPRPEHRFEIEEPGRLLELVRERVTASVVLTRHVPISGRRGLRVIARRAPRGDAPITWVYEFDAGVDPDDPAVRVAAETALRAARDEVGAG